MNIKKCIPTTISFLALSVVLLSTNIFADCSHGTAEQAVDMVNQASDLIEKEGKEIAFTIFMTPDSEFVNGNLYLFAVDFSGTLLANSIFPPSVGSNILDSRNSDGRYYVREMIALANNTGRGWIQYEFIDPCTGLISSKLTYIQRIDDYLIGVGYYDVLFADISIPQLRHPFWS